jgi:hypothetical protein
LAGKGRALPKSRRYTRAAASTCAATTHTRPCHPQTHTRTHTLFLTHRQLAALRTLCTRHCSTLSHPTLNRPPLQAHGVLPAHPRLTCSGSSSDRLPAGWWKG